MRAVTRSVKGYEDGKIPRIEAHEISMDVIRGMAPRCQLD